MGVTSKASSHLLPKFYLKFQKHAMRISISSDRSFSIIAIHFRSFTVELVSGPNVVLHINPRFGYGGCHELVMNSSVGGCWGHEERHHNPFHCGDHFEMKIKVHESHYDVSRLLMVLSSSISHT